MNRALADSTRRVGADRRTAVARPGRNILSSASRALLIWALALVVAGSLSVQPAAAQTPTVRLTNVTRGGTDFFVGDAFRVDITGPPYQEVKNCATFNGSSLGCTVYGQTDANGNFQLSGFMDESVLGYWVETWYVGGVAATPDPLTFYVYPVAARTCDFGAAGSTAIFSLDYVDSFTGWIGYQALGYTSITAALNPAGYCVMHSDSWNIGSSMYASRTILTPFLDQWQVADNGYRPGYDPYFTVPEYYYPFFDATALGFVAINVVTGDLYFIPVVVGMVVEFVYY